MVTIILPISRTEYLKPVFDCLNNLERPADTELLIITDGDEKLQKAVDKRLDSIHYSGIKVINFGDKPAETIADRRHRIAAIHNKAKHHISEYSDLVFCIEDDTVYPKEALNNLISLRVPQDSIEFVSGVELGRWKTKYIGGWICDNPNEPRIIKSVMPSDGSYTDISLINAAGLYCLLVEADLYKQHDFEPLDKKGTNGLGCDVNFGLWMNRKGYKGIMDWNTQCDHIGEKGSVNLGNTKPVQVEFYMRGDKWENRLLR